MMVKLPSRYDPRLKDDCVSKNFSKTLKFRRNLRDSNFDILTHSTFILNTVLIPTCSSQLKAIHSWLDRQLFSLTPHRSLGALTICDYGGGYNVNTLYPKVEQND